MYRSVLSEHEGYHQALDAGSTNADRSGSAQVSREVRWQKPVTGVVKVNWDAACEVDSCKMGVR